MSETGVAAVSIQETRKMNCFFDTTDQMYVLEKRLAGGVWGETLELWDFPFDCQDLSGLPLVFVSRLRTPHLPEKEYSSSASFHP